MKTSLMLSALSASIGAIYMAPSDGDGSDLGNSASAANVINHTFHFRGIPAKLLDRGVQVDNPEYGEILADAARMADFDKVDRVQIGKDADGKPIHTHGLKRKSVTVALALPAYYVELPDDVCRDAVYDALVAYVKPYIMEGNPIPAYSWSDVVAEYVANNTRSSSGETIKLNSDAIKMVSEIWVEWLREKAPKAVSFFGKAIAKRTDARWLLDTFGKAANEQQIGALKSQFTRFIDDCAKDENADADTIDLLRAVVKVCVRNMDKFVQNTNKPKEVDVSAMFG